MPWLADPPLMIKSKNIAGIENFSGIYFEAISEIFSLCEYFRP
jgi:hypothetical protein